MKDLSKEKSNMSKAGVITLIVFVIVLGVMMTVFCVLYAINKNKYETTVIGLENIYQRSFYDLVENVNNIEIKLGKLINSSDSDYRKKMLTEIHENANSAQNNLSLLPIPINGLSDTYSFINQLSGYTQTLSKLNIVEFSNEQYKTLTELKNSLSLMKSRLNKISTEINKGYNISSNSNLGQGDYTNFTIKLQGIKSTNVDYPTMIYDGPFSDSVVNKEIKGLNFSEISKNDALKIVENLYFKYEESKDIVENNNFTNSHKIKYAGESKGKFKTYDFEITTSNGNNYFAQITKKGGKLLTLSSYNNNTSKNITKEDAIKIAENFAKSQGLNNLYCVWSDIVNCDIYLNLAPVVNDIIYYPDLIKVKIDLSTGDILGWEASTYYTNHTDRTLAQEYINSEEVKSKIPDDFKIIHQKLALIPLDYNKEVLCYEFKCSQNLSTYYFYYNVQNGNEENILKVIETDNGNLLM